MAQVVESWQADCSAALPPQWACQVGWLEIRLPHEKGSKNLPKTSQSDVFKPGCIKKLIHEVKIKMIEGMNV